MTREAGQRSLTETPAQRIYSSWMIDVLIYVVVLNLFVEYVDTVVIDSFTISIFTAVLLQALLSIVVRFEHRVHDYFAQKDGTLYVVLGLVATFAILFSSKLVILEVVDLVFGDHVDLGHFVEILALIISMMAARYLANQIYRRLGTPE